jgi:RNA polymerase sigma-70 factor (ECF subfamily)
MIRSEQHAASSTQTGRHHENADLEEIYGRFVTPIYRFLYARVGNREDAEDLTSQVFMKAFGQLEAERPEKSVASWLFTVARTVLADHWRREYRHGFWVALDENLSEVVEAPDTVQDVATVRQVHAVLRLLSPRARAVLELRFLRGYTIEETARELDITPGNVKVTQHRALARAADLMERWNTGNRPAFLDGQAIA